MEMSRIFDDVIGKICHSDSSSFFAFWPLRDNLEKVTFFLKEQNQMLHLPHFTSWISNFFFVCFVQHFFADILIRAICRWRDVQRSEEVPIDESALDSRQQMENVSIVDSPERNQTFPRSGSVKKQNYLASISHSRMNYKTLRTLM